MELHDSGFGTTAFRTNRDTRALPARSRRPATRAFLPVLAALLAGACSTPIPDPSSEQAREAADRHLQPPSTPDPDPDTRLPAAATDQAEPPPPADPGDDGERYTVVVDAVPVDELLFTLARDADMQIDISGTIEGEITLNAVDETLPRLLDRIALQAPIRYRLKEDYLRIEADDPYLESYAVPYVNIERTTSASMDTSTQIDRSAIETGDGQANSARTQMRSETRNRFWSSLERNLANMLDVEAADDAEGTGSRHVIVNRESGHVTVRATRGQHRQIRRFIDRVTESARRQVLIEATVVEVQLSDHYQAGIDWSLMADGEKGFDFVQNVTGTALGGALNVPDPDSPGDPAMTVGYRDPDSGDGDLRGTLRMLETFGDVRVMSSPRITALNNQQSILKVVDNTVFFTIDVQTTTRESVTDRVFETQVNSVPVGLVMSVTPYIGADDDVLLNVRPTVTRILDFVEDPNPELADARVSNRIPEIQVRELESLLRIRSGRTAVLGGLMQDSIDRVRRGLPGLSRLPLIGRLFSYEDEQLSKSELVIFLRPTVVRNGGLAGDHGHYRQMPDADGPQPSRLQ